MPKQLRQPEALFDDNTFDNDELSDTQNDAIERIVDTQGVSYFEAARIMGLELKNEYQTPEIEVIEPSDGVSVSLGARALALKNIFATYNQLNKVMGANIITSRSVENRFNTRYDRPEEVIENMGLKATAMLNSNKKDLRILNATDELISAGYDPQHVQMHERKISKDLLDKFGPGKAYAPARKKVVQKVQRTANRVETARDAVSS